MRLKHRMNVDLPQPDGPMKAVTKFFLTSSDTPSSASAPLYETESPSTSKTTSRPRWSESIWLASWPILEGSIPVDTGAFVVVCDIDASVRPTGLRMGRRQVNVW